MASHTSGPRGRSRKPRPSTQPADRPRRTDRPWPTARAPVSPQRTFGERPNAPWHPLPLSEILILAGAVAFVLAVSRLHKGPTSAGPLLLAGIVAVSLGTLEVTWREHSSGFRSHTLLLALLPVIVLHSAVVLGWASLAKPSQVVNVGMFAVDIALFVLLFRLLRVRFLDARARASVRG